MTFSESLAKIKTLEGDVVEVGVFNGNTARILKEAFPNKKIYLYDTFSGIPKSKISEHDGDKENREALSKIGTEVDVDAYRRLCDEGFIVNKGVFPEEATYFPDKVCCVHIDCDIYQTVVDAKNLFYPKMVEDGIFIVHDYSNQATPGIKKAMDEIGGVEFGSNGWATITKGTQ